jgi:serine/threonine protein phosphatase PrpC
MTPRSFIPDIKKRDRLEWTHWLAAQVLQLPSDSRSFIKLDAFKSFGFTDVRHGRSGNQDRIAVAYFSSPSPKQNWYLAVVCDGVGGSVQGERAAALACASLVADISASNEAVTAEMALSHAIEEAHKTVCSSFENRSSTTLVAFLIKGENAAIGWVGDSRAYQLGRDIALCTRDDTLKSALEMAGNLGEELNDEFADRLSQAIGGDFKVKPNLMAWPLDPGDDCLLCSDGVWKPLGTSLRELIANCSDRSELTRRLLLASDWHGGKDNATAIIIPSTLELKDALLEPINHTPTGCCTICLPGGRQLFIPKLEGSPYSPPKPASASKNRGLTPVVQDLYPKGKSEKATKNKKKSSAQLVIEEEMFNDAPGPTSSIQTDKTPP